RWKRATGAGAVIAFGALAGLIGVAGARGNDHPSGPTPPSVGAQLIRPGGDPEEEPGTAPDDGYFGSQDGGYGFSDNRSRSNPVGRSSVS
ncbi:MAG TPA: hypothetical protein VGC06_21415, partial [Actinomycetes bacterium]